MSRDPRHNKGFVFIAVLGILVVAGLLVFAMNGATRFSYLATERTLGDIEEAILARSGAECALALVAKGRMAADGTSHTLMVRTDRLRGSVADCTLAVRTLAAGDPLYRSPSLAHRPGDVLVEVRSEQMKARYGRRGRRLLCNVQGRRARPIDVTDLSPVGAK